MRPLQVWFPAIEPSIDVPEVRRDAERAFREWKNEDVVWLLPHLHETIRWREGPNRVLAVPSECWEYIEVLHVGANGYVSGPGAAHRFRDGRLDKGLLRAWLNSGRPGTFQAPRTLQFPAPVVSNGRIRFSGTGASVQRKYLLKVEPGPAWPLLRVRPLPVSAEVESDLDYGGWKPSGRGTRPMLRSIRHPKVVSYPTRFQRWPAPFTRLFSLGGGIDDATAHDRMVDVARKSRDDRESALRQARTESRRLSDPVTVPASKGWLPATYLAGGVEGAVAGLEKFGVNGRALSAEDVVQFLETEEIPVLRVWGGRDFSGLCCSLDSKGNTRF